MCPSGRVYIGEGHPAIGSYREALEYAIPNSSWIHSIPIAFGGALAYLHQLSITLAARYRWQRALATVFVLSGHMPVMEPIQHQCDWSEFATHAGTTTALSRIVLTLDPTLTPKEVSIAFQHVRQSVLGASWRDLRDRQLALARFALHRADDEPWPQRMKAWNKEVDENWQYTDVSNFRRACHNALRKLLTLIPLSKIFPESEDSNAETPCES